MASRSLNDLHPALKPLAEEFLKNCSSDGLDILITCTFRSPQEQNSLYEQGRTKPGRIVTNAKGGESAHNFILDGKPAAKAFDFVPMIDGKPEWHGNDPSWNQAGEIGEKLGLEWAGRWVKFKELAHMQLKKI